MPVEQADTLTSLAESISDTPGNQQLSVSGIPGQLITITLPHGAAGATNQLQVSNGEAFLGNLLWAFLSSFIIYNVILIEACSHCSDTKFQLIWLKFHLELFFQKKSVVTIFGNLFVKTGSTFIICLWSSYLKGHFLTDY